MATHNERQKVIGELRAMEQAAAVLLGNHPSSPTNAADFNRVRNRVLGRLTRVRPAANRMGIPIPRLVIALATMSPAGSAESEFELETSGPITVQEWADLADARQAAITNGGRWRDLYIRMYHGILQRLKNRGEQMPVDHQRTFGQLIQTVHAEKRIDQRRLQSPKPGKKKNRPRLNEAEYELESMLVRAGL